MKFTTVAATALCAAAVSAAPAGPGGNNYNGGRPGDWQGKGGPFEFTSVWKITATPDQVVNASNVATGGLAGAIGYYNFGLNSYTNTICYNITLIGFRGEYQSPALTATHVHESAKGRSGPPRIAFPNPVGNEAYRNSIGCIKGPFRTGLNTTGTTTDTGANFNVKQIEDNPAGFNADVHSSLAVPGAVRGQFA